MGNTHLKRILDYDLVSHKSRQSSMPNNMNPELFMERLANAEWSSVNSRVFHSIIDQRSYYLKIFHDRRLRNTIARRLHIKDHDAFREVKTLTALNSNGFNTISACAAFIGSQNKREHSFLVSYDFLQDNPEMLQLDQYIIAYPDQTKPMLNKLADLLTRMISQNFIHSDVHCGNFLTDGKRFVLLDTDDIHHGRSRRLVYKSLDMTAKNMLRDRDQLNITDKQIHLLINRIMKGANINHRQAYSHILRRHRFKCADLWLRRVKGKINADELASSIQIPDHLDFFKPLAQV